MNTNTSPIRRKRGGQPGNQNARKHGFYSLRLTPAERTELWRLQKTYGLDPLTAFLRLRLRHLLKTPDAPMDLHLRGVAKLARVIARRQALCALQRDLAGIPGSFPLGKIQFTQGRP